MRQLPLSRIAQWTGGRLHSAPDPELLVDAVFTDTRAGDSGAQASPLFIALVGERFDGNEHVAAAAARGAKAALVSRVVDIDLPQVVVADSRDALAALARSLQEGRGGKVVAITGSNGKTTVKQMLLSILASLGAAYANPGNRNNEIGLPLAVIDAPEDAGYAIYEMGAGQPGDIAVLTGVARPDVAVVNNVAPAHLERMGSLLGVADTKAAILDALPHDGVAVINADDAFAQFFAGRVHGRRMLRFGLEASADVYARELQVGPEGSRFVLVTPDGQAEVALALPGRHNVRNALAAAALAVAVAGATPAQVAAGLGATAPVPGRLVRHRLPGGAQLIDDSYNANPGSMAAAIELLAAGAGPAWLVMGDMGELGPDARALHAGVGHRARDAGVARLFGLGPLSVAAVEAFGEGGRHFAGMPELVAALRAALAGAVAAGDDAAAPRLLVKGSRASAMERVVSALLEKEDSTDAV